jgi:hypothetical protein
MSSTDEGKALATPDFWNDRYKAAEDDKPTHEWFRSFEALQPFLSQHLYEAWPAEGSPRILHLGCGDSVSHSFSYSPFPRGFLFPMRPLLLLPHHLLTSSSLIDCPV